MNRITTYFDRLQGRLLGAFLIGFAGTLVIYGLATYSLTAFMEQINTRVEAMEERIDLAMSFEAAVVDQISAGQRYLLTGFDTALAEHDSLAARAKKLQEQYAGLADLDVSQQEKLARIFALHDSLTAAFRQGSQGDDAGQAAERLAALEPKVRELRAQTQAVNTWEVRVVEQSLIGLRTAGAQRQQLLLWVLFASTLVALFFAYRTLHAIEKPLTRLVNAANQFGGGDLTVSVNGRMPIEFRVLATAFTGMAERFRTVVGETVSTANRITASASDLSSVSEEVAASSGEVSTAMIDITNGAEEQALGLRSMDEALSRMRQRAVEIDEASSQVRGLSIQIGDLAAAKRRDVSRATDMLREVREIVHRSGQEVAELQRASTKITAFLETIQGIAAQTNLLALNAAIEAARAGDHGRGFAVVADEVRKLADGSAQAADEIEAAVRRVHHQVEVAAATMARGVSQVAGVEEVSRGAESAFEEIIAAVERVRTAATSVDSAADENRNAVQTVEENVRAVGATAESHAASAEQVSAAAEEQSAATEELSAASVELLHAAERLKELVSGFTVG